MWIETDVGSCWWWSSGHSADVVDSITTENLPGRFLDFCLDTFPLASVSHQRCAGVCRLLGIKILAARLRRVILGTAATAGGCVIHKSGRRSTCWSPLLLQPPFFLYRPRHWRQRKQHSPECLPRFSSSQSSPFFCLYARLMPSRPSSLRPASYRLVSRPCQVPCRYPLSRQRPPCRSSRRTQPRSPFPRLVLLSPLLRPRAWHPPQHPVAFPPSSRMLPRCQTVSIRTPSTKFTFLTRRR